MTTGEIGFFHADNAEAEVIAGEMEQRLGITVARLVPDEKLPIDPARKFLVINGDGYHHHLTRRIVGDLATRREQCGLPPFSYVHIDGHDDTAAMYEGDNNSYKSFVNGIMSDNQGGVYILEEGLTGERSDPPRFIVPSGPEDWGEERATKLRDHQIYVSTDIDVLDNGIIPNLFPQTPIGYTLPRLLGHIATLGNEHEIVGADIVGFSTKGASDTEVRTGLDNIMRLVDGLVAVLDK